MYCLDTRIKLMSVSWNQWSSTNVVSQILKPQTIRKFLILKRIFCSKVYFAVHSASLCLNGFRIPCFLHATLTTNDSRSAFGVGLVDTDQAPAYPEPWRKGVLAFLLLRSSICWLLRTCCQEVQLEAAGLKIIKTPYFSTLRSWAKCCWEETRC